MSAAVWEHLGPMEEATPPPIRCLVVDDRPALREGLRVLLDAAEDVRVVASAADATTVREAVTREHPLVAVVGVPAPPGCVEALDGLRPRLVGLRTAPGAAGGEAGLAVVLDADADAAALGEAVRSVAAARGPRRSGRGRSEERPLSPREEQVLALLAEGRSNREIAARLVISTETVKTHVRNVLSRLGASSRAQAVALGLRRGLIR